MTTANKGVAEVDSIYTKIQDIQSYKKCIPKQYEAWCCIPQTGTCVINKLAYPEMYKQLGTGYLSVQDQEDIVKKLDPMTQNADLAKLLSATQKVNKTQPIVVSGVLGELYVISVHDLCHSFAFQDTIERQSVKDTVQVDICQKSIDLRSTIHGMDWQKIVCKLSTTRYLACFVPVEYQLTVPHVISGYATVNAAGVGHGKGDFILIDPNKVVNNNPLSAVVQIVNGMVFGKIFNIRNWADCVDKSGQKALTFKPLYSLIRKTDDAQPRAIAVEKECKAQNIWEKFRITCSGLCSFDNTEFDYKKIPAEVTKMLNCLYAQYGPKCDDDFIASVNWVNIFAYLRMYRARLIERVVCDMIHDAYPESVRLLEKVDGYANRVELTQDEVIFITEYAWKLTETESISFCIKDILFSDGYNVKAHAYLSTSDEENKSWLSLDVMTLYLVAIGYRGSVQTMNKYFFESEKGNSSFITDANKIKEYLCTKYAEVVPNAQRVNSADIKILETLLTSSQNIKKRVNAPIKVEWKLLQAVYVHRGTPPPDTAAQSEAIYSVVSLFKTLSTKAIYGPLTATIAAWVSLINMIHSSLTKNVSEQVADIFDIKNFCLDMNEVVKSGRIMFRLTNVPFTFAFVEDLHGNYQAIVKNMITVPTSYLMWSSITEVLKEGSTYNLFLTDVTFMNMLNVWKAPKEQHKEVCKLLVEKQFGAVMTAIFRIADSIQQAVERGEYIV